MGKRKKKGGKSKKAKKIPFIPKGYSTVTPYLIVHDGKAALEFYKKALGAKVEMVYEMGGAVGHAEFTVGDTRIMMAGEFPEMGAISAKTIGNTPVSLMMYVKSCDKAIEKAVKHGATVTQPAEDKFWGDRSGQIKDPFGHLWTFGTVIEVLSVKEVKKRMKAMGM